MFSLNIKTILISIALLTGLLTLNSAQAMMNPDAESATHNSVYAALKWTFGDKFNPEAVLGYRHAKVKYNGNTDGADASISAKFLHGFELAKLRVKYLVGNEDVQGEVGGGFSVNQGLFTGLGVHAPYSNIGVDMTSMTKDGIQPYVQIDSIKGRNKPIPPPI